jgi:hypothetical protein
MKTIEVPTNRTIVLPKHLFRPADKIVVLVEGDTVVIKKLGSPPLSSIATRVKERALPLHAITREVHAYRRARRTP